MGTAISFESSPNVANTRSIAAVMMNAWSATTKIEQLQAHHGSRSSVHIQ